MFTGIVAAVGRIMASEPLSAGRRLTIDAAALGLDDVDIGDSVAVNGVCLTVTSKTATAFTVDVVAESLARTAGFDRPGDVNLEKSLRVGDRLDGHLVSGHVDATGVVHRLQPRGETWELVVDAPTALARFLAHKGSITVNGVSLTIVRVEDLPAPAQACRFEIALIPHTVDVTTLRNLGPGDRVNLEVDMVARYLDRMLALTKDR